MICVHARIHTLNDGSLHTFWLTYMRTFYHITPCLSRSTVAIRSSARTPISGSCWFRLRPYRRSTGRQQRPLSEPCRRMAGRRRSALQRCLWAACSRRRRKSRTANHFRRWRSRCSAPTSTSICAKSAARWTVHRLSGTWSLEARTARLAANVWQQRGEHSRADIFDVDGWPANATLFSPRLYRDLLGSPRLFHSRFPHFAKNEKVTTP